MTKRVLYRAGSKAFVQLELLASQNEPFWPFLIFNDNYIGVPDPFDKDPVYDKPLMTSKCGFGCLWNESN